MRSVRGELRRCGAVLVLAALVLTAAAWLRSAEYDEQYTLFLTAGTPRPAWPEHAFPAGTVVAIQVGHAGLDQIAGDLRRTDVHPPLYFWVMALWRCAVGGRLFAARLLSVWFALVALAAVGGIAWRVGIPAASAMALTLGCYGFVFTGGIARGFALAMMLNLLGVACAFGSRNRLALAGALFGAALFTNYLAVFVGLAVMAGVLFLPPWSENKGRRLAPFIVGFLPCLAAALWFFIAQRGSRVGQFPPFDLLASITRLARYSSANVAGGLPLYVPGTIRPIVAAGVAVYLACLVGLIGFRWRRISTPNSRWLLAGATIASPVGLLVLGAVFNNTPIELRYLAFGAPFFALLLARAIQSLPRIPRRVTLVAVFAIQTASIAGLILSPETMQPARATAVASAALAHGGPVLVPFGNDGVGIVGAYAIEAPPDLRLLVIHADETRDRIRARASGFPRVVVAMLAQDESSRTTVATLRQAFTDPGWREVASGFNVVAYERIGDGR